MDGLFLFLLLFLFLVSVFPFFFIIRLRNYIQSYFTDSMDKNLEQHVTIIIPTCGKTYNLKNNLERAINSLNINSNIILTTQKDDLSKDLLFELKKLYPTKVYVALAEKCESNAQKLNNQLSALKSIDWQTDYLVFIDSDGSIDSHFISRLVNPLQNENIGITTGWRWYIPKKFNLASHTQILWNASAVPFIIDRAQGLVFGGAMAVRYVDFKKFRISNLWESAISDSLTMANCFKKSNKKSVFVPHCIVLSKAENSFKSLLSWTNRQTTISRVYMPKFWCTTVASYMLSFFVLIITITIGVKLYGLFGGILAFFLYWIPLYVNSILIKKTMKKSFAFIDYKFNRFEHLIDSLGCLTATLTYGINIIRSVMLRSIIWSGIKYKLISPSKTIVYKQNIEGKYEC